MSDDNRNIPQNLQILSPSPPREDLVATAVKFLQNPKVLSSTLEQKKKFLLKKGLTNEEIEKAIDISGASQDLSSPAVVNRVQHSSDKVQTIMPPVSVWNRIRDYSALSILIGGVIYALYTFFKKYVEPIFLRHSQEQEEKLNCMQQSIIELKSGISSNMQDLRNIVKGLQEHVSAQSLKINVMSTNLDMNKHSRDAGLTTSALGELQAEITSVKGLLLSTKQFPAVPDIPPLIPQWQMKLTNNHGEDGDKSENYITSSGDGSKTEIDLSREVLALSNHADLEERNSGDPGARNEHEEVCVNDKLLVKANNPNHLHISGLLENGVHVKPAIGTRIQNRPVLLSPSKLNMPTAVSESRSVGDESDVD